MTLIIHHRAIGAFHAFLTPTWPIAPLPTPATAATDQHSSGTEDEEEGKEQPHVHDDIQSLFLSTKSENILEFAFVTVTATRPLWFKSIWLTELPQRKLFDSCRSHMCWCFFLFCKRLRPTRMFQSAIMGFLYSHQFYRSHSHMLVFFPVF